MNATDECQENQEQEEGETTLHQKKRGASRTAAGLALHTLVGTTPRREHKAPSSDCCSIFVRRDQDRMAA